MSDSQNETTSSSEDEEPFVDEANDKFFFKTLSRLKSKDPTIYDPKVVFFPKDDVANEEDNDTGREGDSVKRAKVKSNKPVYLRDYERDMVVKAMKNENGAIEDGQPGSDEELPYALQQKSLKATFKAALDELDEDENILKVKIKTDKDREKEDEEYKEWLKGNKTELSDKIMEQDLKPLHNFWTTPNLDPNEQFLKDYILNKRYLAEGEEAEDDGVSEDGELLEMQEKFETDYNFRFENEGNTEVKRYPRVIEGSLRLTDDSRKKKRKERKERKKLEKDKKKNEIAKNQKQKLLEFKEQVDKIKKLTGNDQLGFADDEIFGDDDFDPQVHDKKMQELYSDAFYSAGAEDVDKPDFTQYGDELDDIEDGDPDNMDLDAVPSNSKSKKETRSKKKRKAKKKSFTDIMDIAKPVFDPQSHQSYQKYIDEYYGMDCEDFIEDIPCRFRYREVVPNDYGLTVEEILASEDKELNQWVSAKKIMKLKPEHVEKNEVKIYKKKGQDFSLKKKILCSIYGSPKREDDDSDIESPKDEIEHSHSSEKVQTNGVDVSQKLVKKRKKDNLVHGESQPEIELNNDSEETIPIKKKKLQNFTKADKGQHVDKTINKTLQKTNGMQKKTNFGKKRPSFGRNSKPSTDPMAAVSDLRLKAYDIKPREYKKKLKFKKQ